MFYYRSASGSRPISRTVARFVTSGALLAYPAGALILAHGPDNLATMLAGYGLIFLALIGATSIFGTSLQRIVAEEANKLDEYELKLRGRATYWAFAAFSSLTLLAVLYMAIATDAGWWTPRTYDAFNGVFWGVFTYAALLPATVLAWQADAADLDPGE